MDEGTVRMQATMYSFLAEMNAINAEIDGMKAENQFCLGNGHSPAYGDAAFLELADKLVAIAKRFRDEI